jgi:hypothetical protein
MIRLQRRTRSWVALTTVWCRELAGPYPRRIFPSRSTPDRRPNRSLKPLLLDIAGSER